MVTLLGRSNKIPPSRRQPEEQRVTRAFCVLLHLTDEICDLVWNTYRRDPQRAWGLCPAMDLTALLRHARTARRTLVVRDTVLLVIALALPAIVVGRIAQRYGAMLAVVVAAVLVVAWAGWRFIRMAGRRLVRAFLAVFKRHKVRTSRWAGLSILVLGLAVKNLLEDPDLMTDLKLAFSCSLLAWLTSLVSAYQAHANARRVWRSKTAPRELMPRLPDLVEDRLEGMDRTNVVVYSEGRAVNPFVGSGHRVADWLVRINVRRGVPHDGGDRKEPKPVDVVEFYRFLHEQWCAERAMVARCGFRLYVDGSRLHPPSVLLPTGYGPPLSRLPTAKLLEYVRQPTHEEHQRVYFYLESASHHGELVVTLLTRAYLQGPVLFVDITLNALLPTDPLIIAVARDQPSHIPDIAWRVLRAGTARLPTLLLTSPARVGARARTAMRSCRIQRLSRRAVRWDRHVDYGAGISAREGFSLVDLVQLGHNVITDLERQAVYMQARVLGALKVFLEERDIDTSDFDQARQTIVNNIQNWNIESVKAGMVGFGNANTFAGVLPRSTVRDPSGDDKK
ncbi:MAG TPA: hypothetical protein VFB84_20660 [Micromonosporaceae bacterium]|nr:hypothetical protein [Micromonosporaceae bacterium]